MSLTRPQGTPLSSGRARLANAEESKHHAGRVQKHTALQQLRRRAQRHTTEDRTEPIDMPVDGRIVLAVDVVEGRRIEGLRFIWEASPDYLVRPWLAKRRLDLI